MSGAALAGSSALVADRSWRLAKGNGHEMAANHQPRRPPEDVATKGGARDGQTTLAHLSVRLQLGLRPTGCICGTVHGHECMTMRAPPLLKPTLAYCRSVGAGNFGLEERAMTISWGSNLEGPGSWYFQITKVPSMPVELMKVLAVMATRTRHPQNTGSSQKEA
ncbi:hypothetical protein G7046_g6462 [Stylonectria norvegica]|nr:hypothetical protein G7046_g6462 [Stylonectria norvegica]